MNRCIGNSELKQMFQHINIYRILGLESLNTFESKCNSRWVLEAVSISDRMRVDRPYLFAYFQYLIAMDAFL